MKKYNAVAVFPSKQINIVSTSLCAKTVCCIVSLCTYMWYLLSSKKSFFQQERVFSPTYFCASVFASLSFFVTSFLPRPSEDNRSNCKRQTNQRRLHCQDDGCGLKRHESLVKRIQIKNPCDVSL